MHKSNTHTATSGGVTSLNSETGDINLTSTGATVTITPSGQNINLEATGSISQANFVFVS